MVFPKNILSLSHKHGSRIHFEPLDALRRVSCRTEAIEVACAEAWQEARFVMILYTNIYILFST